MGHDISIVQWCRWYIPLVLFGTDSLENHSRSPYPSDKPNGRLRRSLRFSRNYSYGEYSFSAYGFLQADGPVRVIKSLHHLPRQMKWVYQRTGHPFPGGFYSRWALPFFRTSAAVFNKAICKGGWDLSEMIYIGLPFSVSARWGCEARSAKVNLENEDEFRRSKWEMGQPKTKYISIVMHLMTTLKSKELKVHRLN